MNSPMETRKPECPDEAVIEEYVVLRSDRGDASALVDHLASCAACRTRTEELARETSRLTEWLALPVADVEEETCLALEDLGQYLDDSLAAVARAAVESHLAYCAQCRRSLAELYREVRTILADEAAGTPLLSIDEQAVAFTERRDAVRASTSSHAAFSMEEWLKRPEQETPADSDQKQQKPRQSTQ